MAFASFNRKSERVSFADDIELFAVRASPYGPEMSGSDSDGYDEKVEKSRGTISVVNNALCAVEVPA